jgi:hypothetical protein
MGVATFFGVTLREFPDFYFYEFSKRAFSQIIGDFLVNFE